MTLARKADWHEADRRFLRGLQLSTLPELVRAWTKCRIPWRKAAIARAIARKSKLNLDTLSARPHTLKCQ